MKITNHNQEFRRRIQQNFRTLELTDQSFKKQCDINNIMAQYAKTGMLPNQTIIPPSFKDNTNIPTLEDAFKITQTAIDSFNQLPPYLRKLMDNNPSNLASFITDPENHDVLLKHGIINAAPKIAKNDKSNDEIKQSPKAADTP